MYMKETHLALDKMADPSFGHDGDGHRAHDLFNHGRVRHTGHTTLSSDIGRDPLQGHDSRRTCLFGNAGLSGKASAREREIDCEIKQLK
jgi:hypothetical protein